MKKSVSKKLWLLAVVVLLIAVLAIPAMAADNDLETGDVAYPEIAPAYPKRYGAVDAGGYYTDALRSYLIGQFASCPSSINISSYNVPTSKIDEIRGCIWYETPEAFNVHSIGYSHSNGKIATLTFTYYEYSDTAAEYASCWNACVSASNKLLDGIKGNNSLTNVQKALLLHDRLAVWVEYDYENYVDYNGDLAYMPDTVFTMVGVFQNRSAVCQGYTMAYMYLLKQVGIESDYCSSDALCHCWNIVYIGSTPYHVDVTWDDPVWDVTGRVDHYNFLRSTDGIVNTGHYYEEGGSYWIDFDDTPTSTTYDNYYWQNSNTAFQLLNGQIYYLDNAAGYIKKESDKSNLISVDATWKASSTTVWEGNFARLSSTGTELLYSLNNGIYAYNPSTGSNQKIYSPSLYSNFSIFGFTYENGKLVYEQFNSPSYERYTKSNYQSQVSYTSPVVDNTAPTGSLTATNNLTTSQTVTITMRDNVGIAGYYWGTNSSYASNTYTATTATTVSKTVSTSGTYYLTVKDTSGNISSTYSITFYKTTFNGNGGTVTPSYVITKSGDSIRLPAATRSNYTMLGWSTSSTAVSASYTSGGTYSPSTNRTLYAVWKSGTVKNGWITENGSTYYYVDGVKQTGWQQIDGYQYYFTQSGEMYVGWLSQNSRMYYLEEDGKMATGWKQIGNNRYYFKQNGEMYVGWLSQNGQTYYLKTDGKMATGWLNISGKWYYMGADGAMTYGFQNIGGNTYYLNSAGVMMTGWQKVNNAWHFFNSSGMMVTGWLQQGSTWYYLHPDSGAMATGVVKIGNGFYKFNSSGVWMPGAVSGWLQQDGHWYYITNNTMATGWKKIGSAWYYFTQSGEMYVGWLNQGNRTYYMKSSGAMAIGWATYEGKYYYFDSNGYQQLGWVKDGNAWYYMDPNYGYMLTGWQTIGGREYYLKSSGAMAIGWCVIDGEYYYFDANGYMKVRSWVKDGGYWYYMTSDGTMATGYYKIGNNHYYFRDSGVMVTGWLNVGGYYYYFNNDGVQLFGEQTVGGKTYYFDSNYSGQMRTNTWYRVGSYYNGYKYYFFGSDGAMVKNTWMRINGYDYYFNSNGECDRTPQNVTWR